MRQLFDVIEVQARADQTLLLTFENGVRRIFNMSKCLNKKPFTKLKDSPLFFCAKIENGTVIWPGNIDIDPETLWEESLDIE